VTALGPDARPEGVGGPGVARRRGVPPLSILYRDDHLIAVDKPPGLLVHRTRIAEGDAFALQVLRDQIGRRVYPVHRLDRPVSGVLCFAMTTEAARALCAVFESRQVDKAYLAVVRGHLALEGTIDYPLREEVHREPQPAVTRWRRLATTEVAAPVGRYPSARYSLIEACPETGRLHQIRKHLAHLSHPIVGDTTHGDGRHNRLFRERFGVARLLLLAHRLRFAHPFTGAEVLIRAPLPAEVARLFERLGWPPGDPFDGFRLDRTGEGRSDRP
jgi:tRNA pseudouridine65 synthase